MTKNFFFRLCNVHFGGESDRNHDYSEEQDFIEKHRHFLYVF